MKNVITLTDIEGECIIILHKSKTTENEWKVKK